MKHSTGFTLVEVLVAMVILAVGILGLSQLQSDSALHNFTARKISNAVSLARSRLDIILQSGFDQIDDVNGNGCNGLNASRNNADYYNVNNATGVDYHVSWNCCNSTATNNTKEVRLFVETDTQTTPLLTFDYLIPQID